MKKAISMQLMALVAIGIERKSLGVMLAAGS